MTVPPVPPPGPPPVQRKKSTSVWVILTVCFAVCGCLVIPILAAILFPVFAQAKLAARKTSELANMKQLAIASQMLTGENDDLVPNVTSTKPFLALLAPYVRSFSVTRSTNPDRTEIVFNIHLSGHSLNQLKDPDGTVMLYERDPWRQLEGGRCVAFADGRVKFLRAEEWEAAQELLEHPTQDGAPASKPFKPEYEQALTTLYEKLASTRDPDLPRIVEENKALLDPDLTKGAPKPDKK